MSSGTDRIDSLDVLRGFAILGILIMNIQAFANVSAAYVNPSLAGPLTGSDFWIWLGSHVLAEYKFITIFGALFGAGIVLFAERAEAAGADAHARHRRRMFSLGCIGLAHALLLWYGDILLLYAMIGMIAFHFRNEDTGRLLRIAAVLYLVPVAVAFAMTGGMNLMGEETYQQFVRESWDLKPELIAAEVATYQGSWSGQFSQRAQTLADAYLWMVLTEQGWRVLAIMLVGMAAYRSGLLKGEWPLDAYRRMFLVGAGVGIPLILWGALFNLTHDWEMRYSLYMGRQFNGLGAPLVSLAWISLVIIALKKGWLPGLTTRLRAVGRMALTCYLLTTVICTTLFYGHGLGLFGTMDRAEQWLVVIAVWFVLLTFAPLWLRWFRMGPVEWLWRWASYGRRPPFRTTTPSE